ncbi:hypothetical protein QBC44DRAFT_305449 [Cladorrhinum sp. PSN332]|nr:hypothetical protein QBC44DRAFT_305449 [Cladorrhinum sp. PSN332]
MSREIKECRGEQHNSRRTWQFQVAGWMWQNGRRMRQAVGDLQLGHQGSNIGGAMADDSEVSAVVYWRSEMEVVVIHRRSLLMIQLLIAVEPSWKGNCSRSNGVDCGMQGLSKRRDKKGVGTLWKRERSAPNLVLGTARAAETCQDPWARCTRVDYAHPCFVYTRRLRDTIDLSSSKPDSESAIGINKIKECCGDPGLSKSSGEGS